MASINTFVLDGNLTKDVDLSFTAKGTPVARYTIAADYNVRDGEGWRSEASYIPVISYGRQAENDAKYLKRGHAVVVQGEIRSWYSNELGRGGFDFIVSTVRYMGAPKSVPKSVDTAPADEWLLEYDSVKDRRP